MKNLFKIILGFICLFNFACHRKEKSNGGGQDIGGGNVVESGLVSQDELKNFIRILENRRVEIFRALEVASLVATRITGLDFEVRSFLTKEEFNKLKFQAELYPLIFADKDRLRQIVLRAKIEIRETDSCYKGHEPVDGSIFGSKENPICISTFRLAQKLKADDYQLQLLSLYIHEVSHLFGTQEAQAEEMQNQILGIGPNFKNYLSFLFEPPTRIKTALQKMRSYVDTVHQTSSHEVTCQNLQKFFDEAYKLFIQENAQKVTISYLQTEDIIRTHGILVASAFTKDYCESDWSGGKILRLAKWKGRSEVDIKEIYPDPLLFVLFESPEKTAILSQYLLADLSGMRLRSVKEGDRAAMLHNLNQILMALERIDYL